MSESVPQSTECLLSVCIPTHNRADMVEALVGQFLAVDGPFELCVHDDGSTDDTYQRLCSLAENDPRLSVATGPNSGRAGALKQAVSAAHGTFIMLYDDDDEVFADGLAKVLDTCATPLPENVAGYIFQMQIGQSLPPDFPCERSNFAALRADHRVLGDKKEIVLSSVLRPIIETQPIYRRVPTSLYWMRIARKYDIFCSNIVVGKKIYLSGGISSSIREIKNKNSYPMFLLNKYRLLAFYEGRYSSPTYALKSVVSMITYFIVDFLNRINRIK